MNVDFIFTVINMGVICIDNPIKDSKFLVYKKTSDNKYVQLYKDGKAVYLGGSNTCERIELSGDYILSSVNTSCCSKISIGEEEEYEPSFSYKEIICQGSSGLISAFALTEDCECFCILADLSKSPVKPFIIDDENNIREFIINKPYRILLNMSCLDSSSVSCRHIRFKDLDPSQFNYDNVTALVQIKPAAINNKIVIDPFIPELQEVDPDGNPVNHVPLRLITGADNEAIGYIFAPPSVADIIAKYEPTVEVRDQTTNALLGMAWAEADMNALISVKVIDQTTTAFKYAALSSYTNDESLLVRMVVGDKVHFIVKA